MHSSNCQHGRKVYASADVALACAEARSERARQIAERKSSYVVTVYACNCKLWVLSSMSCKAAGATSLGWTLAKKGALELGAAADATPQTVAWAKAQAQAYGCK